MEGIGLTLIFIVMGVFYFLPSIVAVASGKSNAAAICALNFFLGWTLIGWVVSLVWSLSSDRPQQTTVIDRGPKENTDPIERLEKLRKLLDNGGITEEEYNNEKNKILNN